MPLQAGTSLGPYQIEAPLGAGGMGEVYKARDTRLDRTVAIKVLPEHVAADPDLKQRFEREAKTISSMNHPHICTLYDIGQEGDTDFLVMEYLDGETLAQRLEKGAVPLDQALQIAIEIADALDKAHRQGIVHRDLKPANIMLTKAGAKLLDFGLAKLKAPDQGGGLSALPTQPADLTKEGAILSTFQYMAPEQLEGQEADARTDIFAFGAVVYEMVTGRKAFEGKSQASLITAIMSSDPPPLASFQSLSPPGLDPVVRTCLAKGSDDRWQSAGDLGRQMRVLLEGGAQTAGLPMPTRNRRTRDRLVGAVAGGIVTSVVTGFAVWALIRPPAASQPVMRFPITLPPSVGFASETLPLVALSSDGSRLVYSSDSGLFLRAMDAIEDTPIRGTEGAVAPFFSPDAQWIGFLQNGDLKKVSVTPGEVMTVLRGVEGGSATWGDDNNIIFVSADGLARVSADGGELEQLTTLDPDGDQLRHRYPTALPGGRGVLFEIDHFGAVGEVSEIAVLALDTLEYKVRHRRGHTESDSVRYRPTRTCW